MLGPTPLDECMSYCCNDSGCLAVENNAEHCYLFGRRYQGPGFINQSGSNSSILADVLQRSSAEDLLDTGDIVLSGMKFADTDFSYVGYQEGWGLTPQASGMPRDAAVEIQSAKNVRIAGCAFEQLGGGGVHVSQGSRSIDVVDSHFSHLGQSGVVISGNGSTQPARCNVCNNTMSHIGEILASAAGIMASTVSLSK